jgi:hypothetical protein
MGLKEIGCGMNLYDWRQSSVAISGERGNEQPSSLKGGKFDCVIG